MYENCPCNSGEKYKFCCRKKEWFCCNRTM
ncbi:SEC-C metal-binding domain-containing protein [Bacillus thuringiensis]|nr:SEC-C metal-binding domain-containing protein [Bacillus thuringiensis]